MPKGNHPGNLLRAGEFYSPVRGSLRTEDVLLSELRQPGSCQIPRHEHELAYVTVMLHGDYLEGDHGHLKELHALSAVFNPAGVRHTTVIGPAGASLFTIELRHELLQYLGVRLPAQIRFDRGAGSMLWPGLRLSAAVNTQAADPLANESYVLELLAAITGIASPEKTPPHWLGRVKERLHDGLC